MDTGGSSPITSPNPPSVTPDVPVGDPLLDPHSAPPATATTAAVRTAMENLNWGVPVEYLFQGTAFSPQRVMPLAGFYIDANNSYVWHPKCYSLFSADEQGTIRGVCIETPTEIARDLHHKKDSSATPFFPRILVFSMRVPDKEGKPEYRYLYFFRRHPGATLPVEKDTSAYTESEINEILDKYNLPHVEDEVVRSLLTEGKVRWGTTRPPLTRTHANGFPFASIQCIRGRWRSTHDPLQTGNPHIPTGYCQQDWRFTQDVPSQDHMQCRIPPH
jgi:hypothetical protein